MMKRTLLILLAIGLTTTASAQRRKAAAAVDSATKVEQARTAIDEYRFDDATTLLDEARTALTRKKQATDEVDALVEKAAFGERMLEGTDQVLVVDSFVVNKTGFLSAYKLSAETGKLAYVADFFKQQGQGTLYQTELGNRVYFSQKSNGHSKLFTSDKLAGGQWGDPQELDGIGDDDTNEDYPFVTSDGSTLYFASDNNENGLGGYDIYVTRIGNGSKYLRPENLGMPYNSPDNDYMYVVDEINDLGWFATDRYQPEGKVCIYVFVPNESRRTFDTDETDEKVIRQMAMLRNIRSTQTNKEELASARTRLKDALAYKPTTKTTKEFELVIDDQHIYTSYAQFRNAQAKSTCLTWVNKKKELDKLSQQLEANRLKYAKGSKNLAGQIRTQEKQYEQMLQEVKDWEKRTRNLELGAK